MPSVIGVPLGGGAYGSVTTNYLRTKPSTRFGTRELAAIVIGYNGVENNYEDSDSDYSRIVRALQQNVELYAVFTPRNDTFVVLVSADTTPQDDGDNPGDGNRNSHLQNIIFKGGYSVDVFNASINGDTINYD
jgi:hypothetical protein